MVRMRRDAKGRFVGKVGHRHHKRHHRRNPMLATAAAAKAGGLLAKKGALARAAKVILVR